MTQQYTSLFLNGFRGVGKSTIGSKVVEKLGWEYIEFDQELVKRAGRTIPEITKNGTSWQEFRQMEHDLLKELLQKEHIVVSASGGAPVNNIIKEGTTTTFGELNTQLYRNTPHVLIVLITASDEIIGQRIKQMELAQAETVRPILNEERAKEVQKLLEEYKDDEAKQKEILVDEIVKDSLTMYTARKPLYAALTNNIVDTSEISIDEAVAKVLTFLQ